MSMWLRYYFVIIGIFFDFLTSTAHEKALIDHEKIQVLIYNLICTEMWKEKVTVYERISAMVSP